MDIGSIAVKEAINFQKLKKKKTIACGDNEDEDDSDDSDGEITGSQIMKNVLDVHNAHKKIESDDDNDNDNKGEN